MPLFPFDWSTVSRPCAGMIELAYDNEKAEASTMCFVAADGGQAVLTADFSLAECAFSPCFLPFGTWLIYCASGACVFSSGAGASIALAAGEAKAIESTFDVCTFPTHQCTLVCLILTSQSAARNGVVSPGEEAGAREPAASLPRTACSPPNAPIACAAAALQTCTLECLRTNRTRDVMAAKAALIAAVTHFSQAWRRHAYPIGSQEASCPQAAEEYRHLTASQRRIVDRCSRIIAGDLSCRRSIEELAQGFEVSATSLKNYFRFTYGVTPTRFAQNLRMRRAKELLARTSLPVGVIAEAVGYASHAKFSRAFRNSTSVSPLEFRRSCRHGIAPGV